MRVEHDATDPDRRFALFMEELLSGAVNPDEERLRALVAAVSAALAASGLGSPKPGRWEGYPAFTILPTGTRARPPRLILFAARSTKPDVRLADVLDT
jgi:hypothetical protein